MAPLTLPPAKPVGRARGAPGSAALRVAKRLGLRRTPSRRLATRERGVPAVAPNGAPRRAFLVARPSRPVATPRPLAAALARARLLREARVPPRAAATPATGIKPKASQTGVRGAAIVRAAAPTVAPSCSTARRA